MSRQASGLKAWVVQRATAIYLLLFFIYLMGHFLIEPPGDYAAWRSWLAGLVVSAATLVFFLAMLVHAWIGMRDILMDYIWHAGARLVLLALVALGLWACGAWAAQILIIARLS